MTSRNATNMLPLREADGENAFRMSWQDRVQVALYGAVTWPFLLYSLWGGTKASKRRLLDRLALRQDALPNLGSWKADTGLLHLIVDSVEELRPRHVVELGAGATSLVCARALELNGGGTLHSFDQHAGFVAETRRWLLEEGVHAEMHHAPLGDSQPGWPGRWYELSRLPEVIDLLVIDGPPWSLHPQVRGSAEVLFERLAPGGIVLLDDASRPGERMVARRWARNWPEIEFKRIGGGTKGTLVGRKASRGGQVLPFSTRRRRDEQPAWRRAAAAAALLACGWLAHDLGDNIAPPAQAASFLSEADESFEASLVRQAMSSQPESSIINRAEIASATGITLPEFPSDWHLVDLQVYPSDLGVAVAAVLETDEGERVSLFATRAETPAEALPVLASNHGRSFAYWEQGPLAYAMTGEMAASEILRLASRLS